MSLKTNTLSGPGLNISPQASAPKKSDESMSLAVQNALTQAAVAKVNLDPSFAPTPAKKEELIQSAMNLATQKAPKPINIPSFKLGLTKQEIQIIDSMFQRWALYDRICLLELWGLDLYTDLLQLTKYLPKEPMAHILDRFCANFSLGYMSMCASGARKKCTVELEFDEPGVKRSDAVYFRSCASTAQTFSEIKELLQKLASTKMRITSISSTVHSVKKKLELGERLLLHPNAMWLLSDYNLLALANHFPKANALNKSSPQKSLADLILYTQFVDTAFKSAVKLGYFGLKPELLTVFAEKLAEAPSKENLFRAIKQLKLEFGPKFIHMHLVFDSLQKDSAAAGLGLIQPQQYYEQVHHTQLVAGKNPKQFASQLFANFMTGHLSLQFLYDFLDILDEQVMEPLYPDLFVPTSACLNRLNVNLATAFAHFEEQVKRMATSSFKYYPKPPCELSSVMEKKLQEALLRAELNSLFLPQLVQLPMHEFERALIALNAQSTRYQFHQWIPYIKKLEPCAKIVTSLTIQLGERRKLFLGEIEKFLRGLDPKTLFSHREMWIQYFKEFCFYGSLDVCRWIMIAQDIKAISEIHVNMAVVNSEEHLLPEPLVDFIELDGIEELFNKLLFPNQRPMREDLEEAPAKAREKVKSVVQATLQVAPKTKVEKFESKQSNAVAPRLAAPKSFLPPTEEPAASPVFSIRRGEKTRKILSRLREIGFLPVRSRGSHLKLEDEKGQSVIVPKGGRRKHQKPGTSASIASQVNGASY